METDYRVEHDSLGDVRVPSIALYGAQTQRAVDNFRISGRTMPPAFIHALATIKHAAAEVNCKLGLLDENLALGIAEAAHQVATGLHDEQFPVDVFQTGSGTSSNMNMNEVIARIASDHAGHSVHPNDHVNMAQSSNDVVPTAIHLSVCIALDHGLLPALAHLKKTIDQRAVDGRSVVKTGRTHLMDALPLRLDQELGGWASQVDDASARIRQSMTRLQRLAIGGTAVGTGLNAHPEFGRRVAERLAASTGLSLSSSADHFRDLSCQDSAVEMSGQLNTLAVALMKIANDLRWMNSGPLAGLTEIQLAALQPGSSIMPGKVNPVVAEAVAMVCAQVMGHHVALTVAGQSGNFQLNVMLPLVAHDLLESIGMLGNAARLMADKAIRCFTVNQERLGEVVERNPMLVTALNTMLGYEKGAEIAKRAYQEGRPIIEVALELTDLTRKELQRLLDPVELTRGGVWR